MQMPSQMHIASLLLSLLWPGTILKSYCIHKSHTTSTKFGNIGAWVYPRPLGAFQRPKPIATFNAVSNAMDDCGNTGTSIYNGYDASKPLIQIAPMLDVTYQQFRQFMRLLTTKSQLWTEMITDSTVLHAPKTTVDAWLGFDSNEHPVVAQLGGNCIESLAAAADILASYGYDEINLNVGCPSSRVSTKGCFGAALMKQKELVRDIVYALKRRLNIPVTVKHRLGVDEYDSYEFVREFISTVKESGCDHYIVHARKAWLHGVNTRQNRNIPPLHYDRVYRLQSEFPDLKFSINGGFKTMASIKAALGVDPTFGVQLGGGVMLGRVSYDNPCLLAKVDTEIYGQAKNPDSCKTRRILLEKYAEYVDAAADKTEEMNICMIVKPILGVFHGIPGCRVFRQTLSNVADYDNFEFHRGETKHAQFIHRAIEVMEGVNPHAVDEILNE